MFILYTTLLFYNENLYSLDTFSSLSLTSSLWKNLSFSMNYSNTKGRKVTLGSPGESQLIIVWTLNYYKRNYFLDQPVYYFIGLMDWLTNGELKFLVRLIKLSPLLHPFVSFILLQIWNLSTLKFITFLPPTYTHIYRFRRPLFILKILFWLQYL